MPMRRAFARAALPIAFVAAALLAHAAPDAHAAEPLAFTLRTVDNDSGVRVILEFTRKPGYDVHSDSRRIYVTLHEGEAKPPFRKKDFDGKLLEKAKFVEGMRTCEVVLYTGPDFGTFSSFEMGEPFRLVIDLRRRAAPTAATRIGGPVPPGGSAAPPAGGTTAGPAPPAGGRGAAAPGAAAPAPAAPAPAEAPAIPPAAAQPKAAFTVVVDPGHGGDEEGAHGPGGLREKDVTLDIARRLRDRLQHDSGTAVILTRDDDRKVPLDDRTAIANHARADLFVSIHANSSRRDSAHGSETYFLSYQATDDEARSVAALENNPVQLDQGVPGQAGLEMVLWDLAQSAYLKESSDLAEMIQSRLNETLGVRNRGIKQAPFRVLMGATMPAVLVEVAFISSPEEEKSLREPAFKDRIADSVADSVRRFREKFLK
ncbi:MAG TPA: N-acetylmuramoyl-L-alanine amidase [Patescibacteria group bacterium]|nr:N-acetylmuramoyl-L-alanine amidase [Patescibacteria group bacterium]